MKTDPEIDDGAMGDRTKYLLIVIFTMVGTFAAVALVTFERSAAALASVMAVSFFCAMAVFLSERIDLLDLKNMKLKLNKIDAARVEVKAREERVRAMAGLVGEMVSYIQANTLSTGDAKSEEWLQLKLKRLGTIAGKDIDNPFTRFSKKLAEIDARIDRHNPDRDALSAELEKEVAAEVARMKKEDR